MKALSKKEKELISIGAALGSNCVPCIVYHIKQSRKCGITDKQISEAIEIAANVRNVPAGQVISTAYAHLGITPKAFVRKAGTKNLPCGC